jgi:hypothetical protein
MYWALPGVFGALANILAVRHTHAAPLRGENVDVAIIARQAWARVNHDDRTIPSIISPPKRPFGQYRSANGLG